MFASHHPPHLSEFLDTLSALMEDLQLRYCFLTDPGNEPETIISTLEMTVHQDDRTQVPELFQRLRERGYLPLQCLPLEANDYRYDLVASLDTDTRFVTLNIRAPAPRMSPPIQQEMNRGGTPLVRSHFLQYCLHERFASRNDGTERHSWLPLPKVRYPSLS